MTTPIGPPAPAEPLAPTPPPASCTRAERMKQGSRERREQDKRELREAILRTAAELLLAQGYEAFSLRRVAEQLGYSATTIYLYFASKDDLISAIVNDAFERLEQRMRRASDAAGDDPRRRLAALVDAYLRFGLENPTSYRLMFLQRPDFLMSCRVGEQKPRIAAVKQIVEDAVRVALAAGALPPGDVQGYSALLWAQAHGIVSLAIHFPPFDQARARRAFRLILGHWGWDWDDEDELISGPAIAGEDAERHVED